MGRDAGGHREPTSLLYLEAAPSSTTFIGARLHADFRSHRKRFRQGDELAGKRITADHLARHCAARPLQRRPECVRMAGKAESRPPIPSPTRHQRQRHQRDYNPAPARPAPPPRRTIARHQGPCPCVPSYMWAARAAMPARAMSAPSVPITPWKHIQASQDAAAMKANRNGSAAAAKRKRQIGKRGAGLARQVLKVRAAGGTAAVERGWA